MKDKVEPNSKNTLKGFKGIQKTMKYNHFTHKFHNEKIEFAFKH